MNDNGWTLVNGKTIPKKRCDVKSDSPDDDNIAFPITWNVWIHKNSSNDWSINGYDNIMGISEITDMWYFLNNFCKLNYMDFQFIIMRGNIPPLWECPDNENGGAAVIRVKTLHPKLLNIWYEICIMTINEDICNINPSEITGVSFNLKRDLTVIKIWNRHDTIEINKIIPSNLINKYKLKVAYTKNRPHT